MQLMGSLPINLLLKASSSPACMFLSQSWKLDWPVEEGSLVNKSLKHVKTFSYLKMTITNKNYIHEETECTLNFRHASYPSVQNPFLSHLLCKHLKTENRILPIILYGYETWSLF
jgi:hypothetical protein